MCRTVAVHEEIAALVDAHLGLSWRHSCEPEARNGGLLRDCGYLSKERLGIGCLCVVNVACEYALNHATELRWDVAAVDALAHCGRVMPQHVHGRRVNY